MSRLEYLCHFTEVNPYTLPIQSIDKWNLFIEEYTRRSTGGYWTMRAKELFQDCIPSARYFVSRKTYGIRDLGYIGVDPLATTGSIAIKGKRVWFLFSGHSSHAKGLYYPRGYSFPLKEGMTIEAMKIANKLR